jgi:serine protease
MSAEQSAPFPYTSPSETDRPTENTAPIYTGFINILLKESYLDGNVLDYFDDEIEELLAYLDEQELPRPVRLVHSVSPEEIAALEERARADDYSPRHSLNQYWVLDAREHEGRLEELAATLTERFTAVILAYPEEIVTPPLLNNAINEPRFFEQQYLHLAPAGIAAEWVWQEHQIFGEGVRLVDLEQNWDLNHGEFAANPPHLEANSILNDADLQDQIHGTAVLGIIYAGVNNEGIVGVAPGIDEAWALSHYRLNPTSNQEKPGQVVDAIAAILVGGQIQAGDVLLLEVERGSGWPIETDSASLDAIRLAIAHEIVIIEPAGNAGRNLDSFSPFLSAAQPLNAAHAGFEESGAILVGASTPNLDTPVSHGPAFLSNFGGRINCFAWGNQVVTVGDDNFGGTSAAAAIIAGAALLLQSVYKKHHNGQPLTPAIMREWLSDPETGTHPSTNTARPIGIMPDLAAIIEKRLL